MGFIKIGYNEKGEILHTVCNGKPDCADFFYVDGKGASRQAKEPTIIEFSQENLKKMVDVFKNGRHI